MEITSGKKGKTREMARQTATTRPSRKKQPQQTNTRSERKEMIRLNISSCITMANECLQNCVIEKKLERERDKATQFVSFHLVFATISPPHVTFSSFFFGGLPHSCSTIRIMCRLPFNEPTESFAQHLEPRDRG